MHSDPVRPGTPSFRIVSTPAVNPSPTFSDAFEEEEVLFEDVLSPKKLVCVLLNIYTVSTEHDLNLNCDLC